jgi:hypothetical protein
LGDEKANAMIQSNAVRQFLEARGYTVVAFETGWSWSQWESANVFYSYHPSANLINAFESLFIETTLLRIPLDFMNVSETASGDIIQHNRIAYNLGILKNIAGKIKGPKFVFAHLVIPHYPYVYGPNGEFVTPEPGPSADLKGYPDAVTYIDQAILQAVDRIMADSKTPPVIVIQGDHGAFRYSEHAQRMSILNAYYLPGAQAALYPTISPVNTFRVIFNSYFGKNYPLLDDASWYSPTRDRYNFEFVPQVCGK